MPMERQFYTLFISLVIPVAMQMLINSSLIFIDTLMIGSLGDSAIAAVNLSGVPNFIVMLTLFGFQSGSAVLMSQYWGKRDMLAINRVFGVGFISCTLFAMSAALIMSVFPEQILGLMSPDAEVVSLGVTYIRIVAPTYVINAMVTIYAGSMRCMEKPKVGLYIHSSAMVLNTLLNYILIFGNFGFPALGVQGAAISTVISRSVEFMITMIYALFVCKSFKLDFKAILRPGKVMAQDFFKYATPVVLNEGMWGIGQSLYVIVFSHIGTSAVAAFAVASNVHRVATVLNFGVSSAASVIVGKTVGAGDNKRAYQYGKAINILAGAQGFAIGLLLLAVAPGVIGVINLSQDAKSLLLIMLSIRACLMVTSALNITNYVGVLRAGGDVRFAFVVDICTTWLISLPSAYVIGFVLRLPPQFVMLAFVFDDLSQATAGLLRFRSKKWIHNLTR